VIDSAGDLSINALPKCVRRSNGHVGVPTIEQNVDVPTNAKNVDTPTIAQDVEGRQMNDMPTIARRDFRQSSIPEQKNLIGSNVLVIRTRAGSNSHSAFECHGHVWLVK